MALADTSGAIGAVTSALADRLLRTGIPKITVGRPDQNVGEAHLNLFLYEISYDPTLKNLPLDEGQKPPLWMVLKYILTAFGVGSDGTVSSDSSAAHVNLGKAMQVIYQDDLLKLDGLTTDVRKALDSNPEELHVTFDEAPVDLLAKLMQGTDEKTRISVAFQVRPVMIASTDAPDYSLLVGVDYTQPPSVPPPLPVGLEILPSLGALIAEVIPPGFEVGEEVRIKGADLHLSNLSVRLGTVDFPVTMQTPDELRFKVDGGLVNAAGSLPLTVVQALAPDKKRASNMIVANLVPTLTQATANVAASPTNPGKVFGTIDLKGLLLGTAADDTVLALYQNGQVVKMFDVLELPNPTQTTRRLVIADTEADAVPEGEYLVILRVNSQQAPQSPAIDLTP